MLLLPANRCTGLGLFMYLLLAVSIVWSQPREALDEDDEGGDEPEEAAPVEEGFSYSGFIDDDLTASQDASFGHLTGDVQNWGAIIQNYILQVSTCF